MEHPALTAYKEYIKECGLTETEETRKDAEKIYILDQLTPYLEQLPKEVKYVVLDENNTETGFVDEDDALEHLGLCVTILNDVWTHAIQMFKWREEVGLDFSTCGDDDSGWFVVRFMTEGSYEETKG